MRILGITREEAIQVIEDDKRIDRGEKLFELDPELEKGAKKARQAPRTKNYTFAQKEKKAKPEKEEICNAMMEGLKNSLEVENFDVKNAEREFEFIYNDVRYKVVLSVPRK